MNCSKKDIWWWMYVASGTFVSVWWKIHTRCSTMILETVSGNQSATSTIGSVAPTKEPGCSMYDTVRSGMPLILMEKEVLDISDYILKGPKNFNNKLSFPVIISNGMSITGVIKRLALRLDKILQICVNWNLITVLVSYK